MIRHDRSVIEERGGIWPAIARAVYEESVAIAADQAPSGPKKPASELRQRRVALGLPQHRLAALVGCPQSVICNMEQGRRSGWRDRVEAALAKAEGA